ncbi:hypothetical protein ACE1OC_00355 [Streptomyces sp. DSM 116496]|uniref:hypothetical protein n=1 Tax=Streptomyces stoeckheimensis TaxID=3344656 RepID=UPI0038B24CCC
MYLIRAELKSRRDSHSEFSSHAASAVESIKKECTKGGSVQHVRAVTIPGGLVVSMFIVAATLSEAEKSMEESLMVAFKDFNLLDVKMNPYPLVGI